MKNEVEQMMEKFIVIGYDYSNGIDIFERKNYKKSDGVEITGDEQRSILKCLESIKNVKVDYNERGSENEVLGYMPSVCYNNKIYTFDKNEDNDNSVLYSVAIW